MKYALLLLPFWLISCAPAPLDQRPPCELCTPDQTCVEDRCVDPVDRRLTLATFNVYDLENTNAADNLARYKSGIYNI